MIWRALEHFGRVMAHLAKLRLVVDTANLTDLRYAGWQLVQSAWECLALANQLFFDRGLAKGLSESDKFEDKPDGLDHLIRTITTSPDPGQIIRASEELTTDLRGVLLRLQKSVPSDTTVAQQFQQVYPEMRDKVGKLLAACERGDALAAHAEAIFLQHDITWTLNQTTAGIGFSDYNLYSEMASTFRAFQFPDLIKSASGSLEELGEQARRFDRHLRRFLSEHSVDLCELATLDELRHSLGRDA